MYTDSDLSKVTVTKKVSLETFVGFLSQRQKIVCDPIRVTNCSTKEKGFIRANKSFERLRDLYYTISKND